MKKLCSITNCTRHVATGEHSGYEDKSYCREQGFCYPCGDEGQHEISHDNGHESISVDECWICHPELNKAAADYTPKKGHTNTIAKTYSSHANCDHAKTPADRAKCRKARAAKKAPKPTPDVLHTPAGDIRVGSLINTFLLGKENVNVKVSEISLNIKKGRPGWEAQDEGLWGYADDVRRVIAF